MALQLPMLMLRQASKLHVSDAVAPWIALSDVGEKVCFTEIIEITGIDVTHLTSRINTSSLRRHDKLDGSSGGGLSSECVCLLQPAAAQKRKARRMRGPFVSHRASRPIRTDCGVLVQEPGVASRGVIHPRFS